MEQAVVSSAGRLGTTTGPHLSTPVAERCAFPDNYGHQLSLLGQLHTAIGEQLRFQQMAALIEQLSVEIQQVHDQLYCSDEQRRYSADFKQTELGLLAGAGESVTLLRELVNQQRWGNLNFANGSPSF